MAGRPAKQALSQKIVDQAKAKGKQYALGDAGCTGLRLWVGINGLKRWQIRRPGSAKTIYLDAATTTLQEARAYATSPEPAKAPPPRLTSLGALIDWYEEIKGKSWSRRTAAPQRCRTFLQPILHCTTAALTKPWIEDRQEELLRTNHLRNQPYKGSSVESFRKATASWALWLTEVGYLTKSPFRRLRRIPVDRVIRHLDEPEMNRLDCACWEYEKSPIMAARVMLAMWAGMRRGEIGLIERSDIDLAHNRITLRARTTKSKKDRRVYMPPKLTKFLEHVERKLPQQQLPFHIPCPDYHFKKLLKFAGLENTTSFHGLRHSFVVSADRRGARIKTVSKHLGHSSIKITADTYMHVHDRDDQELAQLMEHYRE